MANSTDTLVKYVNKDFQSYKRDLMRYAQAHFSGSYQDFNEASPGMMVLELQAFIADNLAYYMDQQFLELRNGTARQLENIEEFAKVRGYKPKGLRSARVQLDWIIEVPAKASADGTGRQVPDPDYLPILRAGSSANGPAGNTFETLEDLDFGASTPDNPQVVVPSREGYFAVKRSVDSVAGKTVTDVLPVGDFKRFNRVQLGQTDVQTVIDVFDAEGNQWYEVDFLAQNAVFDQVTNTGSDANEVPYTLRYIRTGRRFVVDRNLASNATFLQFGSGQGEKQDDQLVPNIANLALPLEGRTTFTNFILDPQNFLKTSTLGLVPANTKLTVRYRVGGGRSTNVPARTINKVQSALLSFKKTIGVSGLDQASVDAVRSSVEVTNPSSSEGGGNAETPAEIKANAASYFAAQGRCVTKEDFITHVLSMPPRFGRPERAYVKPNEFNPSGLDIHVLSIDPDGHFRTATPTLKSNIVAYVRPLRMVTEGVTILDANVVNLGINFGVVISPRFNRTEVLAKCILELKKYFSNDNMQIGMPVVRSDVESTLQSVSGVISVYKLDFNLKYGAPYSSDINLDIAANTKNGILYCPEDTIFEVRFPNSDITGESK